MYSRAQLSEISENASPSTSGAWKNSAAIVANSARVMCSCGPNLPSGEAGEDAGVRQRGDLIAVPAVGLHIRVRIRGAPDLFARIVLQQTVEDRGDLCTRDVVVRADVAVRVADDVRIVLLTLQRRRRHFVVLDGEHERDVRSRFLERIAHGGVDLDGHVQIDRVSLGADLGNEDVALEALGRVELAEELRGLVGREHNAVFRSRSC